MAYNNGVEIVRRPKRPWPGRTHIKVNGVDVEMRHVSRQTLNRPDTWPDQQPSVHRELQRAKRRARMRLRKLRGWR